MGSISGLGRSPGGGHGNPLQYSFLPGDSHGQMSLEGYSPWGHKESDRTEQLNNNKLNNMAKNITRQTGIWILKVLFHRRTKQGVLNKLVRAC